ncbi:hypothetical protein [Nocardia sp. NPDC049526]|uniref:hypothetical protein n=1 Tax=Nocardia sp. NPDC049526 TaxID=3364316 RepID=UPI0037A0A7B8
MFGQDWKQAGAVLVVVGGLIGIPPVLAAIVPLRETAVAVDAEVELTAPGEKPDTVEFSGVSGWERSPTGDAATAVLASPRGSRLVATVVDGVTDFRDAAQWQLKVLRVQGFDAVFDGGEVHNSNGFGGLTCRRPTEPGVCAIVGKDNLAVTLVLGGDDPRLSELQPILDSLQVTS